MQFKKSLQARYFEAISSNAISLSLSNISKFYLNYVKENKQKVEAELNRVGYFVLKNKLKIGNSENLAKDIQISTYFINMNKYVECNNMIHQRYHNNDIDVRDVGGFFVTSTNELVVFIRVNNEPIENAIYTADIKSVIEHELTHAFDHTNKNDKVSKQKSLGSVGRSFLRMCQYLNCCTGSDIANILTDDLFTSGNISTCINAISLILYKLFTITEFNAHQVSDLEETHNVNYQNSRQVANALKNDLLTDFKITNNILKEALSITPDESPYLWKVIGNVLAYMGYNVNNKSPESVYKYFKNTSTKLLKKFINKKMKNQVKSIISLREKNELKDKIRDSIDFNDMNTGVSFWFSPTGNTNSYLCRIKENNGSLDLTINHKSVKIYGNANEIMRRAVNAFANDDWSKFEFALDNLVDIIVQSIERNFNNINYDPVYDITIPQDEQQINMSNKRINRFADLDFDD